MAHQAMAIACATLGLAACAQTETVSRPAMIGATPALLTTADLRIVTERPHPLDSNRRIVCTEPPPDVAKALSTAMSLSASGGAPSGPTASLSGSNASAEALAELAGRVPGLLALRDMLFRECEAYANGTHGDDGYGLVISRYGEMLVTLILGDAVSSATHSTAILQGVALGQGGQQPKGSDDGGSGTGSPSGGGGATPPKKTTGSNTPAASSSLEKLAPEPLDRPAHPSLASIIPASLTFVQAGQPIQQKQQPAAGQENPPPQAPGEIAPTPATPGTPAPTPKKQAGGTPPKTQSVTPKTPPGTNGNAGTAATATTDPAQALLQMQANYMSLGILGPLMVACINEYDPTRRGYYSIDPAAAAGGVPADPNKLLTVQFCQNYLNQLATLELQERLIQALTELTKAQGASPKTKLPDLSQITVPSLR